MKRLKPIKIRAVVQWTEGHGGQLFHKSCEVDLTIDVAALLQRLGPKAATNMSGHAVALGCLRADRIGQPVVVKPELEAGS